MATAAPTADLKTELLPISEVQPHPNNPRSHPPQQIQKLRESIQTFGCYANATVSSDGYILRNHGVIEAAKAEGYTHWLFARFPHPHDHPDSIKLLVGDNRFPEGAEDDESILARLLDDLPDLTGTGYEQDDLLALLQEQEPEDLPDYDEDIDLSAKTVECPECGHEFLPSHAKRAGDAGSD